VALVVRAAATATRQANSIESCILKLTRRTRQDFWMELVCMVLSRIRFRPKSRLPMINLMQRTLYRQRQTYKQHILDESSKWAGRLEVRRSCCLRVKNPCILISNTHRMQGPGKTILPFRHDGVFKCTMMDKHKQP
jgi:hypothetical protein